MERIFVNAGYVALPKGREHDCNQKCVSVTFCFEALAVGAPELVMDQKETPATCSVAGAVRGGKRALISAGP